ncbi:hypothetical protein [Dyella nitratireducens]|uniref:Uncharacterized protein n=1 Tax=Dyella nitratireducens TaxID=1849580 RepID=A0ABQ1FJJ3_9GAMM|nr:hypothetical protein [Dyella nitratireducens]GGA16463.1 hypothetical protein GCM10010981_00110 [Dyella nitratireducens]GLQ44929.1 hypothetical protein GCM10007902_47790 [Dyella nitratireducens]
MDSLFGRLMTLWALYRLSGPGVMVILLAGIGWVVEGYLGWFALALYIALLIALAFAVMHALIHLINKNSKFLGNKPLDSD